MKCTPVDEKFVPAGSGQERSDDGRPHLTSIIRHIRDKAGFGYGDGPGWDRDTTMEVGFLWEDVLDAAFKDRMAIRPGEVELDGVVGSPDGIGEDPEGVEHAVLEELKCTWRSSRRSPTEDWSWMVQIKSYCKMIGTTVTIMRVLYLMGDYKGSGPQYKVFRIEFTQDELDQNWAMIVANAGAIHGDTVVEE